MGGAAILLVAVLLYPYLLPLRVQNVELVKFPENRLRFKVLVKTSKPCDAFIQYWKKNGRDTLYTTLSKDKSNHTLWISNCTAPTDYQFRVVAKSGEEMVEGKIHPFETQPIYQATPYFDLEKLDTAFAPAMKGKYFLTQILTEPGSAVIIDHLGNIVWYQPFKKGVKVSHWTDKQTVLCIVGPEAIPSSGGDEIVEVNMAGETVMQLQQGKGDMDKLVHHEVNKDDSGNIYALTFDKRVMDLSSVGGAKNDTVHADGIVVFDPKGKKIWEWSAIDYLEPLKDPAILKHKKDMVHANSVFKLKDGDFLVSFRDLNQVWRVAYPSGKLVWKFGDNGDYPLDSLDHFSAQHFAHINQDNQLMILDNGIKRKQTRAMAFNINAENKTANKQLDIDLPKEYYSTAKGNASIFNNNQVLFSLTDPRCFLITDRKGEILWKVLVAGDPYRIEEATNFLNPQPQY